MTCLKSNNKQSIIIKMSHCHFRGGGLLIENLNDMRG